MRIGGGRLTRRVHDLCNTFVATSLAEKNSSSRCVGENMTADRLATICTCEQGTGSWVGLDLVGHENDHVEFFRGFDQLAKVLTKLLLSFTELAASRVIGPEKVHDAVNNEKAVLSRDKLLCQATKLVVLFLAVHDTPNEDVLVAGVRIDCHRSANAFSPTDFELTAKALSDLLNSLGAEGTLCVCKSVSETSTTMKA